MARPDALHLPSSRFQTRLDGGQENGRGRGRGVVEEEVGGGGGRRGGEGFRLGTGRYGGWRGVWGSAMSGKVRLENGNSVTLKKSMKADKRTKETDILHSLFLPYSLSVALLIITVMVDWG